MYVYIIINNTESFIFLKLAIYGNHSFCIVIRV